MIHLLPGRLKVAFAAQFVRFLFTGALCAVFGYAVFVVLLTLGVHYSVATLLATVLGILFNFKVYGWLVFRRSNNKLIFRFFLVYGITYVVNVLCLAALDSIHFDLRIAGALLLLPMGILSYFLQRQIVYVDGI